VGEALELSGFLAEHWEPVVGDEPRPGIESALGAGPLADTIVQDLRELALAVVQAHAQFQACPANPVAPVERGREVLLELRRCLEFLFDDGVQDQQDVGLAKLNQSHNDTSTHDGLALSLEGFAQYAHQHRERLAPLPEFDPALLDEALKLAQRLRAQSALRLASEARSRRDAARGRRNRLCSLLTLRMNEARRTVRFVFRNYPDIAALAASNYGRQRQARVRARKAKS
jgi:hypothetical protein